MRVLYLANYQGPALVQRRRIVRNRALGGSTTIESISRALANRGHEITLLSMGTPAERTGRVYGWQREQIRTSRGAVRVTYLPAIDLPVLNLWAGRAAVAAYLRWRSQWDVALVYNLAPEALAAARRLRACGIPVVFEYADDASATLEKGPGGNPRGARLIAEARSLASGAITVNHELAQQLAAPRTLVVRAAILPDAAFDLPVRPFRAGAEPLRLLYTGGLTRPKGVDLLLEAFLRLRTHAELTIIGTGPLEQTVRRAAAGSPRLIYEGEVSRARLEELLGRAHICINPHRTDAGQKDTLFPGKVAEYVAFGAVVVSSKLGILPDEVRDGIHFYDRDEVGLLAEAIDGAAARHEELTTRLEAARRALREEVSDRAVGARIESLLQGAVRP